MRYEHILKVSKAQLDAFGTLTPSEKENLFYLIETPIGFYAYRVDRNSFEPIKKICHGPCEQKDAIINAIRYARTTEGYGLSRFVDIPGDLEWPTKVCSVANNIVASYMRVNNISITELQSTGIPVTELVAKNKHSKGVIGWGAFS